MSESKSSNSTNWGCTITMLIGTPTAMVGYHIHHSMFWACLDWLFWPLALAKWLVCSEINLTIIKETFSFFFK